jgi:HEAT repeat protein
MFDRLLDAARRAEEWDDHWAAVRDLVRADVMAALAWAKAAIHSDDTEERALAADVLGDVADFAKDMADEVVAVLSKALPDESDDVAWAVSHALAGLSRPDVIAPLLLVVDHPAEDVRWQAAVGLPIGARSLSSVPAEVVDALIRLSRDEAPEVRDWATFGLGTETDLDTPEIRATLRTRLQDESEDVWGEALIGLAQRGDETVYDRVADELRSMNVSSSVVEAAGHLADPRLHALLRDLERHGWADDVEALNNALNACRPLGPA